jgi:hypothetical protein
MSTSSTGISVKLEDRSSQEVSFESIQKARTVFVWQQDSKSTKSSGEKEKILDGRIEQ